MNLPLQDGTEWEVPQTFQQELAEVFQGVDIAAQVARMRAWLLCNPDRRKTRRGIKRFIGNWLSKSFDSAPAARPQPKVSCHECTEPATDNGRCAHHAEYQRRYLQSIRSSTNGERNENVR